MAYCDFRRYSEDELKGLRRSFEQADPFPHVVLDGFLLPPATELVPAFPPPDWSGWTRFTDAYQAGKMYCQDIELIPSPFDAIIAELSAPEFLGFLETLTGIAGLIPDPYLEGGGLHCSGAGGVLTPHTDFHLYRQLELYRRINVLVYLNDGWSEADGGCLELWHKGADQPAHVVIPEYGKCVVFLTDDRSVHGFSTPIREGRWRRSIALYYYTSQEAPAYSGDTNTYWQEHGRQRGLDRARLGLYRGLRFGSRGLAFLAHRANPNRRGPAGG
jgi:hypothetical protein